MQNPQSPVFPGTPGRVSGIQHTFYTLNTPQAEGQKGLSRQPPAPHLAQLPAPHLAQSPAPQLAQLPAPHLAQLPAPHLAQLPVQLGPSLDIRHSIREMYLGLPYELAPFQELHESPWILLASSGIWLPSSSNRTEVGLLLGSWTHRAQRVEPGPVR
eukprot:1157764-Pelagomonas_calceolata.AAC.2